MKLYNEFREANLMCLSETWLTENDGDPEIPGFTVVRGDRSLHETGKRRGGGVCVYVNRHWCSIITVKEQLCTEHLELLTVALRPYYLPREFNQLFITAVYIHPAADVKLAGEGVGQVIHRLSSLSPDSPCFVLGDFNKCRLNRVLPHFKQYVTCLTYKDKTIDLCYGNIPGAFTSRPLSGLGRSDHNMAHLIPAYRQKLKRSKPLTRSVKTWSKEDIESLNGCFPCTDWNVFHTGTSSLDVAADAVSSYVNFCVNNVISCKTVKSYPNNKPWVTTQLKDLLKGKQLAFRKGDKKGLQSAQREIDEKIREEKRRYSWGTTSQGTMPGCTGG